MVSLPSDLLLIIFEELTYEPTRTLKIGYEPFTEDEHISPISAQAAERMQSKCNIVLVCKAWRRAALHVLYEILFIDSGARAQRIYDALELTAEPSAHGDGVVNRGAFVRQIYICAQWEDWRFVDQGMSVYHVPRIIQHCPNLIIFSYRIRSSDAVLYPAFRSIVESDAAQSLLRLDLGDHLNGSHLKSGERGTGSLPNLETLVLPPEVDGPLKLRTRKQIYAPNLRTLVLSWEMYTLLISDASRFDFPKLRWIHILPIRAMPPTNFFAVGTPANFRTMNDKVVSIGFHQPSSWTSSALCASFDLLTHFPNVKHVMLRVLSIETPERCLQHPSITCIALRPAYYSARVSTPRQTQRAIRSTLAKIDGIIEVLLVGHFPQLRRIEIVGPYRGTCANSQEWKNGWVKRLGERRIDFEIRRLPE
ncbi:hypothetical protein DENSPDRAFT_258487 [Dentipellis sp. KUC8613]|nr:hypothetical protein DENSPDRAFT_258487 [Dentipellis sp. KUC8613]